MAWLTVSGLFTTEDATATEEKKESTDASAEQPPAPTTDAKEQSEEKAAPAESEAAPAADVTATPASAKKSGGSKRKSTGGASDRKSLSRKKSMSRVTHLHAQPGEYYLARLRSFPPWPSIVCDEEILPESLLETRPVSAKRTDGTYREDYADSGKRAHERTFPVMFLETNEL